jgi:hypothetical protein
MSFDSSLFKIRQKNSAWNRLSNGFYSVMSVIFCIMYFLIYSIFAHDLIIKHE